ncbi:hypothetical protein AN640_05475 [Candidatus Epulonipiscium fishelsonii]|uniref:Uncharacterized protein n=1 Tax=Candidatus Epulonipiscium fishelsonii TaxID=77094 RepID=A0ACC8XIQ6_9FIRM|nr:hypothetical protein AN640_05475 [Epulopiscium sp. SCG-D08WGA-EpuloA1]
MLNQIISKNHLNALFTFHNQNEKKEKSLFEIWSNEMDKKAEDIKKEKEEEEIKELRKKLKNAKSKQEANKIMEPALQQAVFTQDLAILYELDQFLKGKYITLPLKSDEDKPQDLKDDILPKVQDLISSFSEEATSTTPYTSSVNTSTQSFVV